MKTMLLTTMAAIALLGQASAINLTTTKNFGSNRFGGSLTSTLTDVNSASAYTLNGSIVAKGRISGTTSTAASANTSITVRPNSTGQIKGKLSVKGVIRIDYTKDFSASLDFNPGTFTNTWSTGSQTVSISGINLLFKGRISVAATAKGKAVISTPLHVEASITPTFDLTATGTASVSAVGVTGGVEGSLSLLKASLPMTVVLTPNIVADALGNLSVNGNKVHVTAILSGTLTRGTLKGVVKILGVKNSATIASFNGSIFGPVVLVDTTIVLQ